MTTLEDLWGTPKLTYEYHKDGTQPKSGEVFVFGSNKSGVHGAGAAKAALKHFGAVWGVGVGYTGDSYAIPTKDERIETMSLSDIRDYVNAFIVNAREVKKKYFVTRVGCGLAGYKDSDIAPMFKGAPMNCNFPEEWKEYLE